MDVPTYHKVLIVTDGAINIAPTLEDKVDICQNAIDLADLTRSGETQGRDSLPPSKQSLQKCPPRSMPRRSARWLNAGRSKAAFSMDHWHSTTPSAHRPPRQKASSRRSPAIPDILLAPDLEAGNILAKQLSFLANADSAGMVLGARVPVILTSRADSVRSRIASCAVAKLVAHARRAEAVTEFEAMDDYALVLNAGSSSLKFCVFQRPPEQSWRLEARGQIEGIGTSPRLSVKDADGERLANQDVAARDGT